jgi:hypothetical protein
MDEIPDNLFGYIPTNIKYFAFPANLKRIGKNVIQGGLEDVVLPPHLESAPRAAFVGDSFAEANLVIPESLVDVGEGAFAKTNLVSVTLPSSWKVVDQQMFWECKKLETVNLPSGIQAIGEDAFAFCPALRQIELPASLQFVGGFRSSGLRSIDLPANVMVGPRAFEDCASLSSVKAEGKIQFVSTGELPYGEGLAARNYKWGSSTGDVNAVGEAPNAAAALKLAKQIPGYRGAWVCKFISTYYHDTDGSLLVAYYADPTVRWPSGRDMEEAGFYWNLRPKAGAFEGCPLSLRTKQMLRQNGYVAKVADLLP